LPMASVAADLSVAESAGASGGVLPKPTLRKTPQLRDKDPVTGAKVYANRAEWQEDRKRYELEKAQYDIDYKAWRAQKDKNYSRAPRQHASGSAKRRKAGNPAQAAADNRERNRVQHHKRAERLREQAAAMWASRT